MDQTPALAPRSGSRWLTSAVGAWVAMVAVVLFISGYALYRPAPDTDLLFYVATVHQWEGLSPEANHEQTYREVRDFLSPAAYDAMTVENDYMRTVTADPEAFVQQIPFYSVKVLYPAMLLLMSHVGIPIGLASVLISVAAYALTILLVFGWLRRYHAPWMAWAIASLIALSAPLWTLARLESPDALATLLVVGSLFLILERNRANLGMAGLLVAVLARPNGVILFVTVALALMVAGAGSSVRLRPVAAAAWIGVAVILALGLTTWSGYYGFGVLFYFSVVGYLPYPARGAPALPLAEILRQYLFRTVNLSLSPVPLYSLAGLLAIRARRVTPASIRSDAPSLMVLAVLASIIGGWILAPWEPERYLAPALFALVVLLALSIPDGRPLPAVEAAA